MDFFESQDAARRRTRVLLLYYLLAMAIMVPAVYLVFAVLRLPVHALSNAVRDWYDLANRFVPTPSPGLWDRALFVKVAGLTAGVIAAGTLYKLHRLTKGGAVVAWMLGGTPVDPDTKRPEERRLLHVVEEMAIASGTPVPHVYLLKHEPGINSFAAGLSRADAVLGVTKGCMETLSRDELQGVIAHEFSHILNGDMRLKTLLLGVLNGMVFIGFFCRMTFRSALDSLAKGMSGVTFGLLLGFLLLAPIALPLYLVSELGVALASLIKSALSRQREFLADAAAVQFTRNPAGIGGALKTIGGFAAGSRVLSARAGETSHFFFASGTTGASARQKATPSHPSLTARLRRLDPTFAGDFEYVPTRRPPNVDERVEASGMPGSSPADAPPAAPQGETFEVRSEGILSSVGAPHAEHLVYASALLARMPEPLMTAVRTPVGAEAVVYWLLLSRDGAARHCQMERLSSHAPTAVHAELQRLMVLHGRVKPEFRLPLAQLAIGALGGAGHEERAEFLDNVQGLVQADRQVDLFEFSLQRMIARRLGPAPQREGGPPSGVRVVASVASDVRTALSCLASWGSLDVFAREQAFAGAMARFEPKNAPRICDAGECSMVALDQALDRMAQAPAPVKKKIVDACVTCIVADGWVSVEEAELLRAVADSLDCPIPPLLPNRSPDRK